MLQKWMLLIALLMIFFCVWPGEINQAAQKGDLETVKKLLETQPELLNFRDPRGRTPLHWACFGNHKDLIMFLVEKGAEVNAADQNGWVPLHACAYRDNAWGIQFLIEKGARIDEVDMSKLTPLALAAENDRVAAVKILIGKGADVNGRNDYLRTPLILCARERGGPGAARLLIEAGAEVNAVDRYGDTALSLAAWRGKGGVVDLLLEKGAVVPCEGSKLKAGLVLSASKGLVNLFLKLAESKVPLDFPNDSGGTLLHEAAAGGAPGILEILIKRGLKISRKDSYGWTPLHYAALNGCTPAARLLIDKGALLNERNRMGQSPYNVARERKMDETAELLRSAGADRSDAEFPKLQGEYMGQPLPEDKPEVFAPGIVSSIWGLHSSVAFSPDGKLACWVPMVTRPGEIYSRGVILSMKQTTDGWTPPRLLPFSSEAADDDVPFFSADGKKLFFISARPSEEGEKGGRERIWMVENTREGWSAPLLYDEEVNRLGMHWQFSLDRKGNVFFSSQTEESLGMNDIYCARFENGKYREPVNLGGEINSKDREDCPFIAPNGDYLIFVRGGDLVISFKTKDGGWTQPESLGPGINTAANEICPMVTHDGRFLFFVSSRSGKNQAYWVSSEIINRIRKRVFLSNE